MQSTASAGNLILLWQVLLIVLAGLLSQHDLRAEVSPQNVLVLYNADQGVAGDGFQIANYYQSMRPGVHLLGISGLDELLTGATRETISAENYLDVLRPQILAGIGQIGDAIDVIVTTKGLPLKIDAGTRTADSSTPLWRRYSSLESELTRLDTIATRTAMGDQFIYSGFPDIDPTPASNPYYTSTGPFTRSGSDLVNGDIRLAARLDGYDVTAVKSAIDRAQRVFVVPGASTIVADDDPTAGIDQMVNGVPGGPGPGLVEAVQQSGYQIAYEDSDEAVVAADKVVGYVSHGVNDGSGGLAKDYLTSQLDLALQHGAVFLTHESWNAASFSLSFTPAQGLIADWLKIGGTAGLGHVHEPHNSSDNVTNEDLFFGNMLPKSDAPPGTSGLSFVEAAWSATRQLSYVNTVIGDPLMTWRMWLPGDANLDGEVEYKDFYALEGNWQKAGTFAEGDFNVDGTVDFLDFEILANNWFANVDLAEITASDFVVVPTIDLVTDGPKLSATLISAANLDGDLDVDAADLSRILTWYRRNQIGDVDGDRDTDGRDFLAWQRQYFDYDFTADFEIDAIVGAGDLEVWQSSYNTNRGGDADGDGDTDGRDLLIWQREFNAALPVLTLATADAIPEPASFALTLVSALLSTLANPRDCRLINRAPSFAR